MSSTNGLAIASLVLGIVWVYWVGSGLALIFGYRARRQIRDSGGRQGGAGLAMAGIVLGWVGIGLGVLFAVLVAVSMRGSSAAPQLNISGQPVSAPYQPGWSWTPPTSREPPSTDPTLDCTGPNSTSFPFGCEIVQ
jgi:hypothetical protein